MSHNNLNNAPPSLSRFGLNAIHGSTGSFWHQIHFKRQKRLDSSEQKNVFSIKRFAPED